MSRGISTAALVLTPDGSHASYGPWHEASSLVRWGSVTKVLTAGLAHAAVDAGTLSWATTAGDVLGCDIPEQVTVGSLVAHESGLPRVLPAQSKGRQVIEPYAHWTTENFDAQALPVLREITGPPEHAYSNLGYAVLTRVLEVALAKPWIELVRDHIASPRGIDPLAVDVAPRNGTRCDVVEARSRLRGRPLEEWHIAAGPFVGAGGVVSSLETMARLIRASGDGGVLDPRRTPHAWLLHGSVAMHNGGLLRSGSLVTFNPDTANVGVAHAVGGFPTKAHVHAEKALAELVQSMMG